MAKKTVDDEREPGNDVPELSAEASERILTAIMDTLPLVPTPELQVLLNSGIVTLEGDELTWRPGHLEHIANLYAGDPAKTERDYADDLALARAYSADVWKGLVND